MQYIFFTFIFFFLLDGFTALCVTAIVVPVAYCLECFFTSLFDKQTFAIFVDDIFIKKCEGRRKVLQALKQLPPTAWAVDATVLAYPFNAEGKQPTKHHTTFYDEVVKQAKERGLF